MSGLPLAHEYDGDGFRIDSWSGPRHKPRSMLSESLSEDELVTKKYGVSESTSVTENNVDRYERPVSRQWYYENWTRCSRIPPLNVRRYPFTLDGQPGLYTIAQISRYVNISPSRGSAMLLRRFRLINELLDRTHAVGYERYRLFKKPGDDNDCGSIRWQGHGASKLRNELSLADLIDDEDSSGDLSFNVSAECSRASDRINESFDFEAPMGSSSYDDDYFDGDIYDFIARRGLLDFKRPSADNLLDDDPDLQGAQT